LAASASPHAGAVFGAGLVFFWGSPYLFHMEWFHEIKYDGFRMRVERNGDRVRLITRGGYDWTKRYPWIAQAALKTRRSAKF
jgi:ATP dependent DNA ligase domain